MSPEEGIVAEPTWSFGMTVREILALPLMAEGELLAGIRGQDRVVHRLNMMEVPDVLPWVRPGEMLVTSGYPLRALTTQQFAELIQALAERELAGMCVKLGRFVPSLPREVVDAAEKAGFAVLSMPKSLAFTDLLGAVLGEQLDRQEAALRRSAEIDRRLLAILTEGGGHQEVADAIAAWLGAVVTIASADGLVLAWADRTQGPAGDGQARPERIDVEALLGDGRGDDQDIVVSLGTEAVANIRSGLIGRGFLVVDTQVFDIAPDQLLAVRRAAPIVALTFARSAELAAVESRYRGDLLRSVLHGNARFDEDLHLHAERMGWSLRGSLLVAVAEPESSSPQPYLSESSLHLAREFEHALSRTHGGSAVHGYASEVVLVVPDMERAELRAVMREARAHLPAGERDFHLGVSRTVTDLPGVPQGYREAREALSVSVQRGGVSDLTAFEDIGLARMVALMAESDQSREVVDDALAAVLAERNGDELLRTLETFLSTNCNVAETARTMHFHYNTIRYRVTRLRMLLGDFAGDAERRAELLTACRLRANFQRRL